MLTSQSIIFAKESYPTAERLVNLIVPVKTVQLIAEVVGSPAIQRATNGSLAWTAAAAIKMKLSTLIQALRVSSRSFNRTPSGQGCRINEATEIIPTLRATAHKRLLWHASGFKQLVSTAWLGNLANHRQDGYFDCRFCSNYILQCGVVVHN
jgi:hypothetical protein